MTELLTGKTAIIYVGGGSVGGAAARTFARERATRLADDIRAAGGRAELGPSGVRVVGIHTAGVAVASDRAGAITSGIVNATCGLVPG